MEHAIRLRLFGPVQVERDGEPAPNLGSRKALALLSYLAVLGQPCARAALLSRGAAATSAPGDWHPAKF